MKIKLTTLVVLLIGFTVFAQKDWTQLTQDGFAISYPKDWVSSDQKPQPSMQFLLMSDEKSQINDKFRENINLTLEDLGGQVLSLEDYAKISLEQITTQIPSAKVIVNVTTKINDYEARSVIWSADFGNGMVLKFKQVFILNGGMAYVLTFSSTSAEYDDYIEVGDKILNSFKLAK
ncbi:PsbP-related protein [uncultured Winogradskyella sp.]|uniref:PsbP-related protein n=1 Tax=uncultured Winogradskyella sp. TaxID=395353 RepID=UPI0030D92B1D|tara:strand:- start:64027 stop:64554 length:528 start_codon:yes stop_codon:yes gene_type:complete